MDKCELCGMAQTDRCAWVQEGHDPEDCGGVQKDVETEARTVLRALVACAVKGDCAACPLQMSDDCVTDLLLRCLGVLRVVMEDDPEGEA